MKKLFLRILTNIRSWLAGENEKYDGLKEPKRFFLGMSLAMGPLLLLQLLTLFADHKQYIILGILWIVSIIAMRVWWLEGNLRNYIKNDFIDMTKTLDND